MSKKQNSVLGLCLLTFLGDFVPGAGLAALVFIVSLFQTGTRANYLRLVSLAPLVVGGFIGIVRATWVLLASRAGR